MNKSLVLNSPNKAIDAEVYIPGSKSFTNRALICAAISKGESLIENPSKCDDVKVMKEALKALGVQIKEDEKGLKVSGGNFNSYKGEIDIGPAGTSMRFLTSLIAAIPGLEVELIGSERMHQRPIAILVDALKDVGADIEYLEKEGCPPLKIKGKKLKNLSQIELSGSISSQYISSLLLTSPLFGGVKLKIKEKLVSKPYLELTIDCMKSFAVQVNFNNQDEFLVEEKSYYKANNYAVEGDATGACYFWAIAAATAGKIRTYNVPANSKQADLKCLPLLEEMGCKVSSGQDGAQFWVEVIGPKELLPINADFNDMPDSAQTFAVLASFANGVSNLTGLETLRIKETDRLSALKTELAKVGVKTELGESSIRVLGSKVLPSVIKTYEDHRMAMAFSVLAARISGIEIEDSEVVGKSFPNFWNLLSDIGIKADIGIRG